MKHVKIIITILLITILSATSLATPQPAQAFTIFGIRFFEKKPTPTPTIKPTPTPQVSPTPTLAPSPVLGSQDSLPSTGPETNLAIVLATIIGAFLARKYWQVSHRIN